MRRLITCTLLSLVMFGCSGGTTSEEPAAGSGAGSTPPDAATGAAPAGKTSPASPATTASYDTPEAAYAAFQKAAEAEDWGTLSSLLSRESQAMLAGMSIMASSFATMGDAAKEKELTALLAKHGVNLDDEPEEPSAEELAGGPEAAMMDLTKSIPDVPVFVAEINAWLEENSDEGAGGQFSDLGDLSDLTIDGDTASANSETEFGAQPLEFRKVSGSWVIHLPVGGPPESSMSDFDEPDDGTPGLGTFWLGERSVKLRHAMAYPSKFFDDPCTVVLLTVRPLPERQVAELKQMLTEDGNDDAFFPRGTHLKLSFDEAGELVSLFGWADNYSINGTTGVEAEFTTEDGRVTGKAVMAEPEEFFDTSYRFETEFDAELLSTSE